ncbi:MAG: flagellar basal-body rod protein FlgG [Planctomycetes bacterium]|nr:flagellar basal-body rod protein FlgG [Planctomycetota bacterium]
MSVQTLYTAATGMQALETKLEVIANNLANVNTTAFKADRANFEDLIYVDSVPAGAQDSIGNLAATGISVGLGSRVSSVQSNFTQGPLKTTDQQFDIAITGNGFFQIADADARGGILYTRAGNFSKNALGQLVLGSARTGRLVEPQITIPDDATNVTISNDGLVTITLGDGSVRTDGPLQLATFVNPRGLQKLGDNLYAETDASGIPIVGDPGSLGFGQVQQGMLEASNVEPVREMIDLITTQRGFELTSQAVKAGDEIMQLVNNLSRS